MRCIIKNSKVDFLLLIIKYVVPILLLLIISNDKVYSQNFQIPDSLKNKSYKELYTGLNENTNDSIKSIIYATTYLRKAKKEKDTIRIANAYSQFASIISNNRISEFCVTKM